MRVGENFAVLVPSRDALRAGRWCSEASTSLPRLGEYDLRAINAQVILRELVEPMRRAGAGDPTLLQVLAVPQAIFAHVSTTG